MTTSINQFDVQSKRMWEGGPLRQFSDKQIASNFIFYSGAGFEGYAGSYVCDECQRPTPGVYELKVGVQASREWFCGTCREAQRPKQEQPVQLRKARGATISASVQ